MIAFTGFPGRSPSAWPVVGCRVDDDLLLEVDGVELRKKHETESDGAVADHGEGEDDDLEFGVVDGEVTGDEPYPYDEDGVYAESDEARFVVVVWNLTRHEGEAAT